METICKVCDRKGRGMISIFDHPDRIDQIFSTVSGIDKISESDALCIPCYDEMRIAQKFKQKCEALSSHRKSENKPNDKRPVQTETSNDVDEIKDPIPHDVLSVAKSSNYDDNSLECDELTDTLQQNDNNQETRQTADVNMQINLQNVNTIGVKSVDNIISGPHQESRQATKDTDEATNVESKQTVDTIIKCRFCLVNFDNEIDLFAHEIKHDAEDRPYRCQYEDCHMSFKYQSALKKHSTVHLDKKFQCQMCEKKFHQLGNLRSHERYHTGERPYVCDKCGQSFYESGALKTHYRRHTGERPYVCLHCSKKFSRSSAYKVHQRIHTKDKPYKCDECDKTFISSGKLLMHKRTKSHSGCRPFGCAECSSTFVDKYHLVKHMKRRHSMHEENLVSSSC